MLAPTKDYADIWLEATTAAESAAEKQNATLPPENERGLDCGFAWIITKPARGPFISWCKKHGYGKLSYAGGWQFWYSECYSARTQSISVHEAACKAFAEVLKKHGITVLVDSRLD